MFVHAVFLTLIPLAAFGQALQQAPAALVIVTGTVAKIEDGRLQIRTRTQILTIYTGESTSVRKDRKTYNNVSVLRAGDKVAVRCSEATTAGSERLVALSVTADAVTFRGVIESIAAGYIEVGPGPRFPGPAVTRVRISGDTEYGGTSRLAIGQDVHIVGWDFGSGGVDATRISVYNTDLPLRAERSGRERARD